MLTDKAINDAATSAAQEAAKAAALSQAQLQAQADFEAQRHLLERERAAQAERESRLDRKLAERRQAQADFIHQLGALLNARPLLLDTLQVSECARARVRLRFRPSG